MKILFLSNVTLHHNFFINSLVEIFPNFQFSLINEKPVSFGNGSTFKRKIKEIFKKKRYCDLITFFPYLEIDPFKKRRTFYEEHNFPKIQLPQIETFEVDNVNRSGSLVERVRPDLIIVFGTRRLSSEFLTSLSCPIINIHHAVLPYIRGLDSAIWACYLKKFEYIGSSIHYVNDKLDEGKILKRQTLNLPKDVKLWQIRKFNTELTLELMQDLLSNWEVRKDQTKGNPSDIGEYYSWPPLWVFLKAACNLRNRYL